MCVGVSLSYMLVCHLQAWSSLRTEKGVRAPGTGVTHDCEPPCGCWDSNPGPLEEQLVLLTTEPSLQPQGLSLLYSVRPCYYLHALHTLSRQYFLCSSFKAGGIEG